MLGDMSSEFNIVFQGCRLHFIRSIYIASWRKNRYRGIKLIRIITQKDKIITLYHTQKLDY